MALVALLCVAPLQAQTSTMPSTLRFGSGLMDIPVASVLPHLAITGTYSGFFMKLDRTLQLDNNGNNAGFGPGVDKFYSDGSIAVGLFDRVEIGTTIQSLGDAASGGNVLGVFGRVSLYQPTDQGIGFAVGGRYVKAPDFGNGLDLQSSRLGFADPRMRQQYPGMAEVKTDLSLYGVATAYVRGLDALLPKHDLTLSLGYGTGMFQKGDRYDFYRFADSEGWFMGSALHFGLGENSVLTFMGEYNGFDVNLGTQLDLGGIRLGAQYLASNYGEPAGGYWSEYRKPKVGLLASVALCPKSGGLLCKPKLLERPAQVVAAPLPAPRPDTVRITREVAPALPQGVASTVCLATGENAQVLVTAQGDTLTGPARASISTLRPNVVFAGTYAQGRSWYTGDEAVTYERVSYNKSGGEIRLDCAQIARVGEHMGVPLFTMRNEDRPFKTLYVPVRPGVWQAYQNLRGTRGQ